MFCRTSKKNQRGAALVEFAIGATVFLAAMFAVLEFGRALWTHNALADAARRGARYGAINGPNATAVKNVVVYGDPAGGEKAMIPDLTVDDVDVIYSTSPAFSLATGTVTVSIDGYQFDMVLFGTSITMPDYRTTLSAENAGAPIPGGGVPPP